MAGEVFTSAGHSFLRLPMASGRLTLPVRFPGTIGLCLPGSAWVQPGERSLSNDLSPTISLQRSLSVVACSVVACSVVAWMQKSILRDARMTFPPARTLEPTGYCAAPQDQTSEAGRRIRYTPELPLRSWRGPADPELFRPRRRQGSRPKHPDGSIGTIDRFMA